MSVNDALYFLFVDPHPILLVFYVAILPMWICYQLQKIESLPDETDSINLALLKPGATSFLVSTKKE